MSDSTELFESVSQGNLDRFQKLLTGEGELANTRNEQGISLLMWAQYHRRKDFVEGVMKAGPELGPFEFASLGDISAVKERLAEDPELITKTSDDGFTLLHLAAFFGHPDLVRAFLA